MEWASLVISGVSAVATVVAVSFAVWVALRERTERIQIQAERDALRGEHRRAQAERIVGWVETESVEVTGGRSTTRTVIVVTNGSDLPVFLLSPSAYAPDLGTQVVGTPISLLLPGQTRCPLDKEVPQSTERPYAVLDFRDAAGRRWRRDQRGGLTLISEGEPPS